MKQAGIILIVSLFLGAGFLNAQTSKNSDSKYPGFTRLESGLYYKMLVTNLNAQKPKFGDILTLHMIDKTNKDSIIYSSYNDPYTNNQPLRFPLDKPVYKGDFIEGLALMGVGDSADFITSADSFFFKLAQLSQLPPFIEPGSDIKFSVKMVSILKKEEFDQQQQLMMKQYNEKLEKIKNEEPVNIKKYLDSAKIKEKPTASGLYYIETKKGKGPKAEPGDTVSVHYTGKFLNGNVFDSSIGQSPIKFPLGSNLMIKGWEEGICMMKKGTKAILLIPSSLGYAEKGGGQIIPPYTPLIFEVEVMNIIKGPKKK